MQTGFGKLKLLPTGHLYYVINYKFLNLNQNTEFEFMTVHVNNLSRMSVIVYELYRNLLYGLYSSQRSIMSTG